MGGPFGPSVSRGDSSGEGRAAHGPLHPAVHRSLETLMAPLFVFLLWSWFCHLVACIAFFVSRVGLCMVFKPFKPRPVFGSICLCPSFFCLVCSSTPCPLFLSLSLSLSLRRWGTPNLFGLGFLLCFFDPDAISLFDPHLEDATYTKVTSRTCVCVFIFVVVARWYGGSQSGLAWFLSGCWPSPLWFLSFCFLVWSVFACIVCCCECISHQRRPWGSQSAGLQPLYHHHRYCFGGG